MVKKTKDNNYDNLVYYSKINSEGKSSIIINTNQMIDLNGKIDTYNLIENVLIENNSFTLLDDENNNKLHKNKDSEYWTKEIDDYIKYLKDTLDKDISTTDAEELKKLTIDFNKNFLQKYIGGIKAYRIDLIDNKENYANHLATALVDLQAIEIMKTGVNNFCNLLDLTGVSFKSYMQAETLRRVQEELKHIDLDTRDKIDINIIKSLLYNLQILDSLAQVDYIIKENKTYYEDLHKKYEEINNLIEKIGKKYKSRDEELNKYANAVAPKQAPNKQINLHLPKIFNNTYTLNEYMSIDKNTNEKYDIKLNVSIDEELKDLRDVIFVDEINNKQLSLLPIDLALFIGFTSINNINGGNIPITLTDAFKFISEDKGMRIRKGQKAYQLYDEKMQMFKSFKVKSIIRDRESNKTLIEFKDAIPILENYRVNITSRNDRGYIIGASAILSILNFLAEQEGTDYLTTFSTANNYINDKQSNTIETLNMKYYLIIKILQRRNAKERNIPYNNRINLDELYKQTAQIKGVSELSRDDKKRLREKIEIYLNHLKSNSLLLEYDYEPFNKKQIGTKDKGNKLATASNNAKNDLYIKI